MAYQQQMEKRHGQNNAKSLFGMEKIPSDGQTRNLLDPVAPSYLREPFWDILRLVEDSGNLKPYRHVAGTLLISFDGTLCWPKIPIRSNTRRSGRMILLGHLG